MPKDNIAKVKTWGVSAWDVHIPVKKGQVDFSDVNYGPKLSKWLGAMLSEDPTNPTDPTGMTWVDSLKALLPIFQKHNEAKKNSTVFDDVEMLHFLKFSLLNKGDAANPQYFFCFSTQFDNKNGEQEYIDDMYKKYGALMEVIWRHCEGFTTLLQTPPMDSDVPDPTVPPHKPKIVLTTGYDLSAAFLALVKNNNVDRDATLCFYNSNRDVTSKQVKIFKDDSDKLGTVKSAAQTARQEIAKGLPCDQILDKLLQAI